MKTAVKNSSKEQIAKERRRHVREIRELTIEHRLYKRRGIAIDGNWCVSKTNNMSLVGVLFSCEICYHADDILEARVVMSGLDVFRGFARVVRIEEQKKDLPYRVAVVFVDAKSKLI